ncbi:MAG: insulinase family protein, partial [Blastocatellia bacterium]|nr:insulinase family protein [Blastocatellia bacterium]
MLRVLAVALILLSFTSQAVFAKDSAEKIRFIEQRENIVEYHLSNGMRLLLLQDRTTPVVTTLIVYHVGSRNEAVGYTGATHLLEHMLFKGTPTFNKEKGTQIAAVLESIGAYYNASTSLDRTNYFQTMPSDKLEVALQIEADRMRNSFIRDSDRQSEMTVVRNELEGGENDPESVLNTHTYATSYREHPYHHPTIGWRSDVEGVSTERLKAFYDTFYWPNNATLALIGDFEKDEALRLVEKYFSPIPSSPSPIPSVYTVEPKQQGERRFLLRRSGELQIIHLAWHITNGRDPDIYPLTVLSTLLSQGVTSRLHQQLVEKQLAVSVETVAGRFRDPGLFEVVVTVQAGVKAEKVEKIVRQEIEFLKENYVTQEELKRAKTLTNTYFAYNTDGSAAIAEQLTEAISNGDWHLYTDFTKGIDAVTDQQIQTVVKKYLYDDNLTVGCFEPINEDTKTEEDEPTPKSNKFLENDDFEKKDKAFLKKVTDLPSSKYINGDIIKSLAAYRSETNLSFAKRINRVELPNGAVLLNLQRKSSPTVAFRGSLLAGTYLDPKDKPMLSYITAGMLQSGTKRNSKYELARELENIGAFIDFSSDTFYVEFDGRCLGKDVEKVITLLAEQLREPAFSPEELEKLKTQAISYLKQEKEETFSQAYTHLTQKIFPPDSPFYTRSVEERIQSIESISIKDVERFYKEHYGPNSLVLSVVGDVEPQNLEKVFRRLFENWSGKKAKPPTAKPFNIKTYKEPQIVSMKDKANADILIGQ